MIRPEGLDGKAFAEDFLDAYLEHGFLSMPKKEIDLTILQLLLRHTEGWNPDRPPTAFALARQLRAKRGRLRSMLDELSFRSAGDDERTKERLRELLISGEKDIEGNKVRVQIEDGYVRDFAKNLIQQDFGIVDTSFERSIITLSGQKFMLLVSEVMSEDARKKIEGELVKYKDSLNSAAEKKSLLRMFLEEFAKSTGKESGKKLVQLGAAAITGGLSEIPEIIDVIFGRSSGSEEKII